jgi:hypothetical protein
VIDCVHHVESIGNISAAVRFLAAVVSFGNGRVPRSKIGLRQPEARGSPKLSTERTVRNCVSVAAVLA